MQIVRIVPCINYVNGVPLGVIPSLARAVNHAGNVAYDTAVVARSRGIRTNPNIACRDARINAAADWYSCEYNDARRDPSVDIVEFAPLGRFNDADGQWQWPTSDELDSDYMHGFHHFLVRRDDPSSVRASFGCPRHRFHFGFKLDASRLPACQWQFDDLGTRSLPVTRHLLKYSTNHNILPVVLETIPTDTPSSPRMGIRFDLPPNYERFIWRVRADIVDTWRRRPTSPLSNLPPDLKLSLYLPAKDCETFPLQSLKALLPHLTEVCIQGPIPLDYHAILLAHRESTR